MCERSQIGEAGTSAVVAATGAILELLENSSVSRLRLRCGDLRLDVRREPGPAQAEPAPAHGPAVSAAPTATAAGQPEPDVAANVVSAPLVGVFYRRPAPGQPPFVEVGQRVDAGQQVAIVEAMKMMNAITADQAGLVTQIHVEDAEVVEFGQPLLTLVPG